jgi:capsule polysaccharide export protein KpsE/RkpR
VVKGGQAAAEYRKLQDQWKASPKAGKAEDSLWTKFRAAGDAIFAAKKATDSELASSQTGNLKAKIELIDQAEKIDTTDLESAKKQLGEIQTKWVKVGHVAKEEVRKVEDRLRKVEKKIADAQAEAWRRSDPAAKARSNSLVSQLEAAIAGLEAELTAAPATKQKELKDQIAARQAWLEAAQKAVD